MKKTNPRLRDVDTISFQERSEIINAIASVYFTESTDEYGNTDVVYTPHLGEIAQYIAIAEHFIDGLEFDDGEDAYESIIGDTEILKLVLKVLNENIIIHSYFEGIMDYVRDIVEYEKRKQIARIQNESSAIIAYKLIDLIEKETERAEKEKSALEDLGNYISEQRNAHLEFNKVVPLEKQKEFIENFNPEDIVRATYNEISNSDLHKRNQELVEAHRQIRERDAKIIDLQEAFAREKQDSGAKDTTSDVKPKSTRKRTTRKKEE